MVSQRTVICFENSDWKSFTTDLFSAFNVSSLAAVYENKI